MFSTVACLTFFLLLWTPHGHSSTRLWRVLCVIPRGWIISQECSWISIMQSKGWTLRPRDKEFRATQLTITLISAPLSKASLNSNPWTPELHVPYFLWFCIFIFWKVQISGPNFQWHESWTLQVWHASTLLATHHNEQNKLMVTLPGEGWVAQWHASKPFPGKATVDLFCPLWWVANKSETCQTWSVHDSSGIQI